MTQAWNDPGMSVLRTPATFDDYWRGRDLNAFDPENWEGELPTVTDYVINHASPVRCDPCIDKGICTRPGHTSCMGVCETPIIVTQEDMLPKDNPNGEDSKPTNPKDAIGSDKLPLHLWPETATALGCLGMLDGALKYGRANFRAIGVRSSIYVDAAKRHIDAYFEGEDIDPDSGLPHMAHALACLAIIVDAEAAGKLTDDRQIRGGWRAWIDKLTPYVPMLKAKHADKHPKHYSIQDNEDLD